MLTPPSTLSIEDEHVSPIALPNETLLGWVKWNDDADIDRVIIKCESDVEIKSLINVNSSIAVNNPTVEIPADMLTAGGFVGFAAIYSAIPDSKRQISFQVDLVKGEKVKTITLSSYITKPEIIFATHDDIVIDNSTPQSNISFDLFIGEETPALDPKLSISIIGKNLQLTENNIVESIEENVLYEQPSVTRDITVKGKGTGFMVVSIDYSDVIGNVYHEVLQNIPFVVKNTNSEIIRVVEKFTPQALLYVN